MKAVAACSAAVIRFGLTSVEHMEPETSRASMIVADDDGTGTVACGRAAPTASTARPSISSAAGVRRRQRERAGIAVRTSAIEVTRTTARLRLRRISHQAASTSGMTRSASSAHGQEKDIQTTRPVRVTVSTAPAASSTRARAMNAPANGSGSLVTVSLKLIDEAIPSSSPASDAGWYVPAGALAIDLRAVASSAGNGGEPSAHDGGARGGAAPAGVDVPAGLLGHRARRVGLGIGAGAAAGGPAFV